MLRPILTLFAFWLGLTTQTPSTPADATFYAVSYVEVAPGSSRTATIDALKAYEAACRKGDGFVRLEVFEQVGRPGHFAYVETWKDSTVFDTRSGTLKTELANKIQSIRISDVDQRPYKTLTVVPSSTATNNQTVYVITHVDVSPNPQVAVLLQRMAEESRRDDGNIRFDVLLHTMRSNHFTVIEAWRNRQALDAHAVTVHTKKYREELSPFLGSPLDERLFEGVRLAN
jgi:quinol monooxygenase YgiN